MSAKNERSPYQGLSTRMAASAIAILLLLWALVGFAISQDLQDAPLLGVVVGSSVAGAGLGIAAFLASKRRGRKREGRWTSWLVLACAGIVLVLPALAKLAVVSAASACGIALVACLATPSAGVEPKA